MLLNVVDNRIIRKIKGTSAVQKASFLSAIIWGIVTHLAAFSAGLMYHDGVNYSGLGATYTSARWMLGILDDIGKKCLGIYELPYINGLFTVLMLAIVSMLTVKLLKVRSVTAGILIGAILVSFPSVASLFSVTFTAPAYALSLLMSVLSVYILDEKRSFLRFAAAAGLMCMSLGIYQAYITFAVSLAITAILCDVLREKNGEISPLIKKGLCWVALFIAALLMYLLVNKIFLSAKGLTLTTYQNIDKMGKFSFNDLKQAAITAYSGQLKVIWQGIISSYFMRNLTRWCELLTVLLMAIAIYSNRDHAGGCILAAVLFLLLPLAYNSIYLLCAGNHDGVHALMRLSLSFTYILPLLMLELLPDTQGGKKGYKLIGAVALASVLLVPLGYTYRDNTAYLHAETAQKEAILYFNSLVTRIRDTDGYDDGMPVAYIGSGVEDEDFAMLPTQGNIYTYQLHYSGLDIVNNFQWRDFCALHLGWRPQEASDTAELAESEVVRAMPCYPAAGSIRVIDGTVVVKFS